MKEINRKIRIINKLSSMEVSVNDSDEASKYVVLNGESVICFCESRKEIKVFLNGIITCLLED